MTELLITSSIDPIEEGQVFEKTLPRHVTIWQYFTLPDGYVGEFINDIGHTLNGFSPLEIMGADTALYGLENDTPVRKIMALGGGATLITLHTLLGGLIDRHDGTIRNPEWAYQGFNPHVTYVDGAALEEAEYVKLRTVELIEKHQEKPAKVVRKVWELEEIEAK